MSHLSKREMIVLTAGIIFVLVFLVVQFGMKPALASRDRLEHAIVEKEAGLKEMAALQKKLAAVSGRPDVDRQILSSRKKGFTLFAYLDAQVQQSGLKEKVVFMKPMTQALSGSSYSLGIVKLKLRQVYLKELVEFIRRVESPGNGVSVSSLSLNKAGKDKKTLDVIMETQTLVKKEKG